MPIMCAVVYRHWLEIRDRAGGAVVMGTLLSLVDLVANAAGEPFGAEGFPLLVHIGLCSVAALYAGIVLGGTGIRTDDLEAGHPSLYYTLALPVSRFALIWTRFAVALAVTAALFMALLVTALLASLITGHGAGPGELARASFLIGLLAVAVQAIGLLIAMWDDRLKPVAFAIILLLVVLSASAVLNGEPDRWPWLSPVMAFAGNPPATSSALGMAVLTVSLSLTVSVLIAYKMDL